MGSSAVEITLLEPVIASFDVSTAAAPTSLPFLPGAMLWGVLVSRAYRDRTSADEILAEYHGGGLRIDDALLAAGGSVALPAPRSLHRLKVQDPPTAWEDWSDGRHAPGYKAAKDIQIGPGSDRNRLAEVRPRMFATQRTAIDPDTLRASEGQFYGLQALAEGQMFVATLSGPAGMVSRAVETLEGEHVLGKSRNAEFGRVSIRQVDPPPLPDVGKGKAPILWCLADLAAHDRDFQPSERPGDDFFGAAIDWSRSFVRHRSYSPFNAKWRARQPERLVISRGSVIVLKTGIDAGQHRFGFFQEQGLGRVLACAAPPLDLLAAWQPTGSVKRPETGEGSTDLVNWLAAQAKRQSDRTAHASAAASAWDAWKLRYAAASDLAGEVCGPTPSQLGPIARESDDAKLRELLEAARDSSDEKEKSTWQARFAAGARGTFAAEFLSVLDDDGADALRRIAHALRTGLTKERWFDGR